MIVYITFVISRGEKREDFYERNKIIVYILIVISKGDDFYGEIKMGKFIGFGMVNENKGRNFDGRFFNDGFYQMFRKRCRDFNGGLLINDGNSRGCSKELVWSKMYSISI